MRKVNKIKRKYTSFNEKVIATLVFLCINTLQLISQGSSLKITFLTAFPGKNKL